MRMTGPELIPAGIYISAASFRPSLIGIESVMGVRRAKLLSEHVSRIKSNVFFIVCDVLYWTIG